MERGQGSGKVAMIGVEEEGSKCALSRDDIYRRAHVRLIENMGVSALY